MSSPTKTEPVAGVLREARAALGSARTERPAPASKASGVGLRRPAPGAIEHGGPGFRMPTPGAIERVDSFAREDGTRKTKKRPTPAR